MTFILKVNVSKALYRIKKRRKINRYDKFSKTFYTNVQKAFIKIAKKDKKRCVVFDNTKDSNLVEKLIFKKVLKTLGK